MLRFTLIILSLMVINGCSKSNEEIRAEGAQVSINQFEQCDSESGSFYENECQTKTVVWYALVGGHSSDGVNLDIMKECDDAEVRFDVDAENLDYDYSKANKGKCVEIYASIEDENFVTPDVKVIETLWIENDQEQAAREKVRAEKKKVAEREANEAEREANEKAQKLLANNKNNAKWLSDEYGSGAAGVCTVAINKVADRVANYSYEWTDDWTTFKFPSYLTSTKQDYVLTVTGNNIKFQNGYGAWKVKKYWCDYHVKNDEVVDAGFY